MISLRRNRAGRNDGCRRRFAVAFGGAVVALHLLADAAWAQKPAQLAREDGGWMQWVITAAIAIIVFATAFINPKRSHLT